MISNDFSWSHSRSRTFRECRRAYWFSYYGHWGGWDRRASERTRLIYALKKITPLAMLVGDIVHKTIFTSASPFFKNGGDVAKSLKNEALLRLREAWRESKSGQWKSSPKKYANLFEHYYGAEVSDAHGLMLRERMYTCLDTFFNSDVWREIQATPAETRLAMEDLDSFEIKGIKVFAKPDLAFNVGSKVKLYDWKTGKPSEEDAKQIAAYVAFALYKGWADLPENIEPYVFYLNFGEPRALVVDDAALIALEDKITSEAAEMKAMCADPDMNTALEGDFGFTNDLKTCHNCQFRAVCLGAARSGATPEWLKQPFGPDLKAPINEQAGQRMKEAA